MSVCVVVWQKEDDCASFDETEEMLDAADGVATGAVEAIVLPTWVEKVSIYSIPGEPGTSVAVVDGERFDSTCQECGARVLSTVKDGRCPACGAT